MRKILKSKRVFIAALLLIVLLIVVAVIKLSGSSTGKIVSSTGNNASSAPSFNFTPVNVAGKYASFAYPKSLIPTTADKIAGATLETYSYYYRDIESWKLSIDVVQLHYSNLSQDSGYAFRGLNPSEYKKSVATYNKQQFVIMTDSTAPGFSEVAYSLNGNRAGEISLYGDDTLGTQDLIRTFAIVLNTWQWGS
jgi:hypothetical protein